MPPLTATIFQLQGSFLPPLAICHLKVLNYGYHVQGKEIAYFVFQSTTLYQLLVSRAVANYFL